MHRLIAHALPLAALLAGCSPTYSPPMRTTHVGAPRTLPGGRMELGTGASVHHGWSRGAALRVGLPDDVQIELGSDIGDHWQLGLLGLRWVNGDIGPSAWVIDLEAGAGLGLGGELCGNPTEAETRECGRATVTTDGREWDDRIAYGGYAGAGVARHWDWFALYGRARSQVSTATEVPTTVWWSSVLGGQITLFGELRMYAAGGLAGFNNRIDEETGVLVDVGLALQGG